MLLFRERESRRNIRAEREVSRRECRSSLLHFDPGKSVKKISPHISFGKTISEFVFHVAPVILMIIYCKTS